MERGQPSSCCQLTILVCLTIIPFRPSMRNHLLTLALVRPSSQLRHCVSLSLLVGLLARLRVEQLSRFVNDHWTLAGSGAKRGDKTRFGQPKRLEQKLTTVTHGDLDLITFCPCSQRGRKGAAESTNRKASLNFSIRYVDRKTLEELVVQKWKVRRAS
ncbi:hypothetical protein M514_10733 [Trichuris suis]|uniref:Uncharacterized protein n=1 Tax=Trichuris suis TaxID=68888 RepID=A0A085LTT5_9BILA|nr:hypothetical protein M513_10733 [Trichuris suis]KFD61116.1 hypothetical protein M514_10733 [Trichuris suis]